MSEEITIQGELAAKFPFMQDKIRIQRSRRMFAEISYDKFLDVFEYAVKDMRFVALCTITGIDLGETIGLIYHLARDSGVVLNLSTSIPKERPILQSVIAFFPTAEIYEREVVDLLGIQMQGLPEGTRYPLPDDWPTGQYPLRKDWKPECLCPMETEKKEAANG